MFNHVNSKKLDASKKMLQDYKDISWRLVFQYYEKYPISFSSRFGIETFFLAFPDSEYQNIPEWVSISDWEIFFVKVNKENPSLREKVTTPLTLEHAMFIMSIGHSFKYWNKLIKEDKWITRVLKSILRKFSYLDFYDNIRSKLFYEKQENVFQYELKNSKLKKTIRSKMGI